MNIMYVGGPLHGEIDTHRDDHLATDLVSLIRDNDYRVKMTVSGQVASEVLAVVCKHKTLTDIEFFDLHTELIRSGLIRQE